MHNRKYISFLTIVMLHFVQFIMGNTLHSADMTDVDKGNKQLFEATEHIILN